MQRQKRVNKSREQLLSEMKNNKEFKDKLAFSREVFYPALTKASVNVEDAVIQLSMLDTLLMQSFLRFMKEKTFKDLNIQASISSEDPKSQDIIAMLDLLNDKTVYDAKDILEGLKGEIELFRRDYFKKMTLDQLPTKWLDQID